ncbi:hypothetical protein ACFO4P_07635 [Epilithonimonas pallida]|uniref:Uncharacterized protein n=1 Tax=Epilithonimonas pallida TaxID=373671 RepID=A0ABY1R6R6_9FLAO|nr:hypothetical protein [Epilithonimonas pallida]SMP94180.1 hypothetical protein SAMN05421679_105265 [Epilithonimonas pallida]
MITKKHRTQIIQLLPEVRANVAVILFFIILSQCFYGQIYVKGDAFIYVKDSSFFHADSIIYLNTGKHLTPKPVNKNSKIYILEGALVYQLLENSNAQIVYVNQQASESNGNPKKLIPDLIAQKEIKSLGNYSHQVYNYQYKSATESNIIIRQTENIIAVLSGSNTNLKKLDLALSFLENTCLYIYSECSNTKIKTIPYFLNFPFLNTFRSRPPPYSKT